MFGGGSGTVAGGTTGRLLGRIATGAGTKTAATTPPAITDPAVQAAAEAARAAAAQAYGRGATILTSALGDLSAPALGKKTLLGA